MEGARNGLWRFADPSVGKALTREYIDRDKPGEAAVQAKAAADALAPTQ